ncbi:hypothetical protein DPEC_G00063960 [Dallia pectoralis]|uniref:Uncharacterized protein n=1 Tax=Dallia pectoralis TaxID=75939 RepID=A0ACC2H7M8_DALPE|nr:hypothetical protein DPEC_G00063960 [Dallia pectoralis]
MVVGCQAFPKRTGALWVSAQWTVQTGLATWQYGRFNRDGFHLAAGACRVLARRRSVPPYHGSSPQPCDKNRKRISKQQTGFSLWPFKALWGDQLFNTSGLGWSARGPCRESLPGNKPYISGQLKCNKNNYKCSTSDTVTVLTAGPAKVHQSSPGAAKGQRATNGGVNKSAEAGGPGPPRGGLGREAGGGGHMEAP